MEDLTDVDAAAHAPRPVRTWTSWHVLAFVWAFAACAGIFSYQANVNVGAPAVGWLVVTLVATICSVLSLAALLLQDRLRAARARHARRRAIRRRTPSEATLDKIDKLLIDHNHITDKPQLHLKCPVSVWEAADRLSPDRAKSAAHYVHLLASFCEEEVAVMPVAPDRDLRPSVTPRMRVSKALRRCTGYVLVYRTAPQSHFVELLRGGLDPSTPHFYLYSCRRLTTSLALEGLEMTSAPTGTRYLTLRQKRLLARVLLADVITRAVDA